MGVEISKALKKSDGDRLVYLLETWTAFLLHSFKINCRLSGNQLTLTNLRGRRLDSVTIEGSALDCGPQNIVLGETIHAFDLEWQANRPVPLSWVLNRNAKHIIRTRHFSKPTIQAPEIVGVIANILGLELTPDDIVEANNLEKQFQSGVALVEPSNLTPLREPPGLS
jgi:hypothetical protein